MSIGRIPIIYLRHILAVAAEHGIRREEVLAQIGIVPAAIDDDAATYSVEQGTGALRFIRERVDIPGLGLMVGARESVTDHGVLGYAVMSSSNVSRAIDIYTRYQEIIDPELQVQFRVEGDDAILDVSERIPLGPEYQFRVEVTLANWLALRALLQTDEPIVKRVSVTWSRPSYADLYAEIFQCPIEFDAVVNEMRLPVGILERPLSPANDLVAKLCVEQCEALMARLGPGGGAVERVRRELLRQPGQFPGLDRVAVSLHVSSRTLRRQLAESGMSFRDIAEGVRVGMAQNYLRNTNLSTQQISHLVGYSEPTNLHRVFRKRCGMTPREYRLSFARK